MRGEERKEKGEERMKKEDGRGKKISGRRQEAIPILETLNSFKGMVLRPKKSLSLEEMDEAIAKGVNR